LFNLNVHACMPPLSKPFKAKDQAEKARLKLLEKEQREVAVGVIRIKKVRAAKLAVSTALWG